MDPPHVTEFASQRYFDKLKHLPHEREQPQGSHTLDGSAVAQPSTFILPIGRPKSADESQSIEALKSPEKKRANFKLRSILPTRTSSEHDRRRLSTESTKRRRFVPSLRMRMFRRLLTVILLVSRSISSSWHFPMNSRFRLSRHYRSPTY